MKYTLLETSQTDTIFTNVEFEFEDGTKEVVNIAHFQPQSIEEIQDNIMNRYESIILEKSLNR